MAFCWRSTPKTGAVLQLAGDVERLLGRAPEEALQMSLGSLIGEDAAERLREPSMQDAALSRSGVFSIEVLI